MTITVRKPLDREAANMASILSSITFVEPTKTQQNFKDECDINNIVDRFLKTNTMPDVNIPEAFGDYLNAPGSFHEALNLVIEAQDGFNSLPSNIRARFNNDPGALLDFLQDENNLEEAYTLGLVEKPAEAVKPASESPPLPNGQVGESDS